MSKLTETEPALRAMDALRDQCRELYRQMGRDAMLRQADPVETLFTFAKRLISDREYVIGWNDGFEFRDKRSRAALHADKGEQQPLSDHERPHDGTVDMGGEGQ